MTWEPKEGTGWHGRMQPDGGMSYGLMLEARNERGPCLFVHLLDDDIFEIASSPSDFVYECPGFADIQRVELDFNVNAWSVKGFKETDDGRRVALLLQAVGHRGPKG
jgi:hypothetical protein